MRDFGSATLTALQTRTGLVARTLIWVSARNRATNAVETMGLWTGGIMRISPSAGCPGCTTALEVSLICRK